MCFVTAAAEVKEVLKKLSNEAGKQAWWMVIERLHRFIELALM